jgi:D-alanyl-D-alanine carboxypeptidase
MARRGFFVTLRGKALAWRLAAVVTLLAAAAVGGSDHAQARESHHQAPPDPSHNQNYADIVVDDNSGQILHALNPDAPRHPASLTKIMTLYLLFEQLEAGVLKLDTPLPVSAKAALQPPTKLHLKPNQTLTVEDAIGGMATRSANDAAVVVSEAIGGSEEDFAKLMTQKARELGMANTTYVNASGLPADEQITTARDQALLGHAIHDRFPTYYRYFSMISYRYHGVDIRNHNMLLGNVEGVDGIKTGFTEASGYNLITSVHRNDKYIVAVVLGETSNGARDARMRVLIDENIRLAATQRPLPISASASAIGPVAPKVNSVAPTPVKSAPELAGSSRPIENFEQ